MFRQRKIDYRVVAIYVVSIIFLIVLLPLISIKIFPQIIEPDSGQSYDGTIPKTVTIYREKSKKTEKVPFEDYILGVVASEMPASFEPEALKAQAVASRTYALGRIKAGTQLCDTTHCQVYRSDNIDRRVKKAVTATKGQVLISKGKLASHALYFASSGGKTENSEDVFSTPFPYLVSVNSTYEPGATHKKEKNTMSIATFSKKIKNTMEDLDFGAIKKSNIKIKSHSNGGRVSKIKVGKQVIEGTDVRAALGLYSTRFTIDFKGSKIIITTSGSGHGVGMSQYGAHGLAKKGKTYREILSHYYRGTKVSS